MLLTYLRNDFNDLYCKDDDAQKVALKIVADFFVPRLLAFPYMNAKYCPGTERSQPYQSEEKVDVF